MLCHRNVFINVEDGWCPWCPCQGSCQRRAGIDVQSSCLSITRGFVPLASCWARCKMAAAWDVHINFEWRGYHWYGAALAADGAAALCLPTRFHLLHFLLTSVFVCSYQNNLLSFYICAAYFPPLLQRLLARHYSVSVGQRDHLKLRHGARGWGCFYGDLHERSCCSVALDFSYPALCSGDFGHVDMNAVAFFTHNIWAEINVWGGFSALTLWDWSGADSGLDTRMLQATCPCPPCSAGRACSGFPPLTNSHSGVSRCPQSESGWV